ncbi:MAG: UDP-N-acetylmuramate dehydrogenase [Clostridia bacterium]|nr:UDP-N-acetylmuramate dehydrogenase [Clostridia bacterium]
MFLKINNITYLKNEPLIKHCSFKIGGKAKHFISAHNVDALLDALYTCKQHSIKYKVVGNGSNLLFDDLGFDGAIIKYDNDIKQIKNGILQASSGCFLSELIQYTTSCNLSGFEFAIGVPAQLGGAITNNLGAYNQEISTYIDHVTILKSNQILYLTKQDCNFKYHSSNLQNDNIVLGATFNLPFQDKAISRANALQYFTKRTNTQPLNLPNAGSIFKRINLNNQISLNTKTLQQNCFMDNQTSYISPAQLIDTIGLKGLTIGGAQVSTKHAGFIVNIGNAKSNDILKLIEIIKNKIYEKYNINLQLEIEYLPYR